MRNLTTLITTGVASLVLLIGAGCSQAQEEAGDEAAPAAEDVSDEGADDEGADDEGADDEGN